MVLSIKDPEADRLARTLAARTGETITEAVVKALRDRLATAKPSEREIAAMIVDAKAIAHHYASLPLLDPRTPEEILGYDEDGLPT